MAIFSLKTPSGSIEVTERGHRQVAIFVDELGETTAIDLPVDDAVQRILTSRSGNSGWA